MSLPEDEHEGVQVVEHGGCPLPEDEHEGVQVVEHEGVLPFHAPPIYAPQVNSS